MDTNVVNSPEIELYLQKLRQFLDTVILTTDADVFIEGSSLKTVCHDETKQFLFKDGEQLGETYHLYPTSAHAFEESVADIYNIPRSSIITFETLVKSEQLSEADVLVYRDKSATVKKEDEAWFLWNQDRAHTSLNSWILEITGKVRLSGNDLQSLMVWTIDKEISWIALRREYKSEGMSFQERRHRHLHALGFEGDTCKLIKDALDEAEPEESIADVICFTLSHYGTIQELLEETEMNRTIRKAIDGLGGRYQHLLSLYDSPINFMMAIQSQYAAETYKMQNIALKARHPNVKIGQITIPSVFDNISYFFS